MTTTEDAEGAVREDAEAVQREDAEAVQREDAEAALRADVEAALRDVVDPCSAANGSNLDVVEMGLVDQVEISDGEVVVDLLLTTPACDMVAYFHEEITAAVGALDGVESVDVSTDHGFEWTSDMMTDAAQRRREAVMEEYAARHRDRQDAD